MAHYIAELIHDAEIALEPSQRESARGECSDAILRLWKHRSSAPRGVRPLANLAPILETLRILVKGEDDPLSILALSNRKESEDPWCRFIQESYSADRRMATIVALVTLAESSFDREKKWLKDGGELLSEEEREIIRLLDIWLNSGQTWLSRKDDKTSVGELEPDTRIRFILNELEELIQRQQEALKNLKKRLSLSKAKQQESSSE